MGSFALCFYWPVFIRCFWLVFRPLITVNVTSRLGSVTQAVRGDFQGRNFSYGYRIAKCAQNMLSLCLAGDPELEGITIISINPGLLLTDCGASDAKYSAEEGAARFIDVLNRVEKSGIYHAFKDEALY